MDDNKNRIPYILPEPLRCDPDEEITMELVNKYIERHRERLRRYRYLDAMYKGFHDIFFQPDKPDWKPDYRMAFNFCRAITDSFRGYGYGIPIVKDSEDNALKDALDSWHRKNHIRDHEAELIKACCKYGHAWEYFYQDEGAVTRVKMVEPPKLFCVYEDNLQEKAMFAVRGGRRSKDDKVYGEVMTREKIMPFEGDRFLEGQERDNPYGMIPIVEWQLNSERLGLYESICTANDIYNFTISEKSNDVAAFAEAYMAILGAEVDDEGVKRIRDDRIINFYGTDDAKDIIVQFLTKPSADGTQENLLNRITDMIYLTSMTANFSDDSFGGNPSGIALAYKLLNMDSMAETFDMKIQKSLEKRYKIFCSLPTNFPREDAWKQITYKFTRKTPKNMTEEAQILRNLEGVVSRETQYSAAPNIVPDVEEELKRMDQAKADEVGWIEAMTKMIPSSASSVESAIKSSVREDAVGAIEGES